APSTPGIESVNVLTAQFHDVVCAQCGDQCFQPTPRTVRQTYNDSVEYWQAFEQIFARVVDQPRGGSPGGPDLIISQRDLGLQGVKWFVALLAFEAEQVQW